MNNHLQSSLTLPLSLSLKPLTLSVLAIASVCSMSASANLQDFSRQTKTISTATQGDDAHQPENASVTTTTNISTNVNVNANANPNSNSMANAIDADSADKDAEVVDTQMLDKSSAGADISDGLPKLASLENNDKLTLNLPQIEHFKTDNGVPVSFFASTSIPIVDIDIRFNAGSARDGEVRADGFGIANMVATMLTQGTHSLNEDEYNRMVEQFGLNLSATAHKDMFVLSLRSLSDSKHLTPAVDLISQVLTEPTFDTDTLERNKARLLVGLKQQQQDPSAIASIRFNQELYGDHPYAHPSSGTLATVPTLSRDDLQQFHHQLLVASNASIAITGNLSSEQARQIANQITSQLAQGQPAKALPDPQKLEQSKYVHVPFDSTQTTVLMGHLGKKRSSNPEQWQAQMDFGIANHVLAGGDFNARLMKEIRKKRGLTYGIYGSMTPMQSKGSYKISFSTRNDKLNEGIRETLKTIQTARQQGLTAQEIKLTKDQLSNSFPMSFASNSGINNLLGMMNFYHLPDSYLAGYLTRIEQATPADINQHLKEDINPDKFLIVTVGDEYTGRKNK